METPCFMNNLSFKEVAWNECHEWFVTYDMRSKDMKPGLSETKRYDLSMDMLDLDETVTLE